MHLAQYNKLIAPMVRGTEIRHIALHERGDKLSVVVPVYRTSQMGVMTVRSETELAVLKTKAQ